MNEEIIQIIPGDMWQLVNERGNKTAVVCLALVEKTWEDGTITRHVAPMTASGSSVAALANLSEGILVRRD